MASGMAWRYDRKSATRACFANLLVGERPQARLLVPDVLAVELV